MGEVFVLLIKRILPFREVITLINEKLFQLDRHSAVHLAMFLSATGVGFNWKVWLPQTLLSLPDLKIARSAAEPNSQANSHHAVQANKIQPVTFTAFGAVESGKILYPT